MESDAVPLFNDTTPREVPPSMNVTEPVGTPTAGGTGLTVAVSVTACPRAEGLGVEDSAVMVPGTAGALTIWTTTGDVLTARFTLPLYTAVSEWLPAARLEMVSDALPLTSVTVPRLEPPSRKLTVPVGTPIAGDRQVPVPLSDTVCPN